MGGNRWRTAARAAVAHLFSCGVRKTAKATRPSDFIALRMLANVATGSAKNMTPKREKTKSKLLANVSGNVAEHYFCLMNAGSGNALPRLRHGQLRHISSQYITAWPHTGREFEHGRATAAANIDNSFSEFRRGVIQRYPR
jgi:hypothetical protein